jgi:hypothetical protein
MVGDNGTLSIGKLPSTIQDAINLTRLLGEQFLCVDSICIDQDNIEEKEATIIRMDEIYLSATHTIVAAGGDADHGLPELHTGFIITEPHMLIPVRDSLVQVALARPSLIGRINQSRGVLVVGPTKNIYCLRAVSFSLRRKSLLLSAPSGRKDDKEREVLPFRPSQRPIE